MKTSNAIRKLERAGFEVQHYGNFEFHADKGDQRITWIDRDSEVQSLYLLDLRFTDDPHSDYCCAGTYPRSVKAAIESANLAIKQRKDEAPTLARKRREAEEQRAASVARGMYSGT